VIFCVAELGWLYHWRQSVSQTQMRYLVRFAPRKDGTPESIGFERTR
jgi:hypothetical protein